MPEKSEQIDKRIKDAIARVLCQRMGRYGFRDAAVRAGLDHDGDPVLFIEAHYDLVAEPIDPAATVGLIGDLRNALDEVGEERFPHVRHDFHDDQKIAAPKKRTRV